MATTQLNVTFEGPGAADGVSISDLSKVLTRVQRAMRLMVEHLADVESKTGRPKGWVRRESELKINGTSLGSLIVELGLAPPSHNSALLEQNYALGSEAISRILNWRPDLNQIYSAQKEQDMAYMSQEWIGKPLLPDNVAAELLNIYKGVSPNIGSVSLGGHQDRRRVVIPRPKSVRTLRKSTRIIDSAVIWGYLRSLDWPNKTGRLERIMGKPVPLKFAEGLDEDMRRLANRYVQIRGKGKLDEGADEWINVSVHKITGTRNKFEPFDRKELLDRPIKPFDPESIHALSPDDDFDVDEFIRIIREGRDV